jgi:DNA invertase Pin-like site-specific DNA recombinase
MKVGYARISTSGQDTFHQEVALKGAACEKIFYDQVSGSIAERPGLSEMMEFVRPGDVVVIYRLDRLARSLPNLITLVGVLADKKVSLCSLHENLDTTSAGGRLIFHIFGALAEFERNLISERTKSGLEAARIRGRIGGRPEKLNTSECDMLKNLYKSNEFSVKELCLRFNVSKATFYRSIK